MGHRVLVADDAGFMRAHLRDVLTDAGYEVVAEVGDALSAVEAYREHRPDIVTMDVIMPGNGIVAIEQIMKQDPAANILVVTAVGQKELIDQAIGAGAKGTIHKPIQPNLLLTKLDRILGEA